VKDAYDFFEAGGTGDQLREIAEAAKTFEPPAEPTKTDNAAEPAERVTSAGMICVSDEAKISAVPLYYYADKSSWFAPDNRGGFFKASSAAALAFLAACGFSKVFKDSQGNSPAERAMFWKMQNNSVAYAGELAGCPAGCHKINGRYILVTHSPELAHFRRLPVILKPCSPTINTRKRNSFSPGLPVHTLLCASVFKIHPARSFATRPRSTSLASENAENPR
jgi:hypothetical protein